jgi:two-component system cell cycle response regulator DivK
VPSGPPQPLVLIVDDNEPNRRLARDVLLRTGFRTLEAGTGAEGLALAEEHLPDVILLDLRLPDMDGQDTVRMLASSPRTTAIPVVAFSSLELDDPEWLIGSGFAGQIAKPIDVATFSSRVRRYCG